MLEQDILSGGPLKGIGLFGVSLILFTIITWVGLGYLTRMSFDKKCTSALTTNQVNMTRLASLLLWVTLVMNVIGMSVKFESRLFSMVSMVLSVVSLVGVVYLISFAFDEKCTSGLTMNETMVARLASVMLLMTVVMHLVSYGKQLSDDLRGVMKL